MKANVLLITPPFTQLNTPYPATAYLKGFLNTQDIHSSQVDLGIEVILLLFTKKGLDNLFSVAEQKYASLSLNSKRIIDLKQDYIDTIEHVIAFLQNQDDTLSYLISERNYLPEASRFNDLSELEWAFGTIGIRDKARHLATLYLEDISDLIVDAVDPLFGFSRYAERLARSANLFDELHQHLQNTPSYIDQISIEIIQKHIETIKPNLIALSIPFPGNLYGGLRIGQWVKEHFPNIKIALGGGFANTELRSISEKKVFHYIDYICLDDGESTILELIHNMEGKSNHLKRTFIYDKNEVKYQNDSLIHDFKQKDVGTPDYSGLPLDKYLSVIEVANPMHRLWSDGRWNKLTLAHGCYWGKCTFCDISLDYIKIYESASAKILVDRIEELIKNTKNTGFHFVDEAAPPALMREVALEILRRKLTITWWTNIRFEKSFSADLCKLLAKSGCIAVSGGLEVASDRLLKLIDKGVTVEQVTKVTTNFTDAGIMVHAYLMYGFPTQTDQETIDSMEIVRQLFELGIVQSGFWHQFAMTAHSPVGINPEKFDVINTTPSIGSFANNDLLFKDKKGCNPDLYSEGLKKSLFNYMHGIGFEKPLQFWFDHKIKNTTIPKNYLERILNSAPAQNVKLNSKILWVGGRVRYIENEKKVTINGRANHSSFKANKVLGSWIEDFTKKISESQESIKTLQYLIDEYESCTKSNFDDFFDSEIFDELRDQGLLIL